MTTISFSIYRGGRLVREQDFDRAVIHVGKLSTSSLQLDDVNCSRKHAVIERRDSGEWRLTDLGSTNGTTLNGRRVTQSALSDGDRIVIGGTTLVVHLAGAGAADSSEGRRPTSRPSEEIHGLGENTFYAGEEAKEEGAGSALEVALLWGETVLGIEHFKTPQQVRIGEEWGSRFFMPKEALGEKSIVLVDAVDGKFGLNVTGHALEGDVLVDGSVMPLGELSKLGKLQNGFFVADAPLRARFRAGEFVVLVSYGPMPEKPRVSPLTAVDYNPHIFVSLSAIVHIAFLVFLSLVPEEQLRGSMDARARSRRLIEVIKVTELEKLEEEKKKEEEEEATKKGKEKEKLEAKDVVVETKTPEKDPGLLNKLAKKQEERQETLDPQSAEEKKQKAREMAMTAGAAKALAEDTGLLNSLLEDSDSSMMFDGKRLTALGSAGDADPLSAGAGSIDPFGGTLAPGGGTDGGFAGSGSIGGSDGGLPDGTGGVVAGLDKKSAKANLDDIRMKEREVEPVAIASTANVSGKLDRNTVQSIIRRNLSGIKWCYQDALQRDPDLKGKVTLAFSILPNGRVENPQALNPSISDAALLECIRRKMERWKFPSPKDGGVVQVSYPLILKTR